MKQQLLPQGHRNRPGHKMSPKGLLFHTTNNWSPTANAQAHARYMETTPNVVSWHVTVDHEQVIQHIPFHEIAWHAGDGNGYYNSNYIGMEICCNRTQQGKPLDKETYDHAILVAATICKQFGFGWDQLQPHKIVKGKDCPHHTLMDHVGFKSAVFSLIEEWDKPQPVIVSKDEPSDWAKEAWEWAIKNGITDGTRPKDTATREEFITMLYRALDKYKGECTCSRKND